MFLITKKAQAAMEFLMTYGWAILVVLSAIGALAYFGVLNPDRFLPEKCIIASGSGLYCYDHNAFPGSGVNLRIQNVLTEPLVITGIILTDPDIVCSFSGSTTIPKDGIEDFTVACSGLNRDQKIKADMSINYNKVGGLTKTASGNLVTKAASTISSLSICQNAEDGGLCGGLDLVFGEGYQVACCSEHSLCC